MEKSLKKKSNVVYSKLLSDLVDNCIITEWQAGCLFGIYSVGSYDYSYYKLSNFIYSNLRSGRLFDEC